MKIELNKAYINRICEVVWITEETPGSAYPFTGKTLNGDNLTYSETGKFSEHDQHPLVPIPGLSPPMYLPAPGTRDLHTRPSQSLSP